MKKRIISLFIALALCLTLLPTAVLASDTSGHWAEKTIAEWQQKGYISGYSDGTFRPDNSITRAEFAKLLNRVLGLTDEAAISFTDVKETDWYYSEVAKAVAAGYANGGIDGTFRPDAPITRAEVAVMLTRALGLAANESRAEQFADADAIPAWAKDSVGAVAEAGYMTGYPNGAFGAQDNITRAEAVVTLDRTQNVTIEQDGTVLTDKIVAGDLIIAESVGEGKVTLKNVTVEGDLIIRGGANSVDLDGVTVLGEVRLEKEDLHLCLLDGTKLGTVLVAAKVRISGSGTIEHLIVSVSDVTIDRRLTIRETETVDGAKTPTVFNPIIIIVPTSIDITSVSAVSPVTVDCGTAEADAMVKLPKSVVLNCADGTTVSATVSWTLDKPYDVTDETGTVYQVTGTVAIPDGYNYNGKLTVQTTLTTLPVVREVTGVASTVSPVTVDYATDEAVALAKLPKNVSLNVLVGKVSGTIDADVKWTVSGYIATPDTTTNYIATGTIVIPAGYTYNGGELKVTATITVRGGDVTIKSIKAPTGFEVGYGTSEVDAMKRLPGVVLLETYGSTSTPMFADVTWKLRDGETYNETPTTVASFTYIGTMAIPDGYIGSSKTIETTIKVLLQGQAAAKKKVIGSVGSVLSVNMESYTEDMDKIKAELPTYILLQCEDDSYITCAIDIGKWSPPLQELIGTGKHISYIFTMLYKDVTLPDGHELDPGQKWSGVNAYVNVPFRDNSKLQEAIDAAHALLNTITEDERVALNDPNKMILKVFNDTQASDVPEGVKFITRSDLDDCDVALWSCIRGLDVASEFDLSADQDCVDSLAIKINMTRASLNRVLMNNVQNGTAYKASKILDNVKGKLDMDKQFGKYAYSDDYQPLTQEGYNSMGYHLPEYACGVQINADEDEADIKLNWSMSTSDYAVLYVGVEGVPSVKVTTVPTTPQTILLTVKAQLSTGDEWFEVTSYDCIIGAPIAKDENVEVETPELTAGTEQEFKVEIPIMAGDSYTDSKNIASIDHSKITAECSNGTLIGITVMNAENMPSSMGDRDLLLVTLKATTKTLSAAVDSPTDPEKGKVKLYIPRDAITLTEAAKRNGWYIPKDGLTFEADVKVCPI